jgi:tRNA pseudouridine13 synthase
MGELVLNEYGLDIELPYITSDLPGIGGRIKMTPEHFIVEEIPRYQPLGVGKHLHVNITKENMTTRELQVQLARVLDRRVTDIGVAGLKDKHAISTQTFSINLDYGTDVNISEAIGKIEKDIPVKVNFAALHPRKLRTGRLYGNRFNVTITDLDVEKDELIHRAIKIKEALKEKGLPNFYGVQRTGVGGNNVLEGYRIIKGEKKMKNPWLKRLLISSFLGYLCNKYLKRRIEKGYFAGLLRGDIAQIYDSGGVFWVEDLIAEQPRFLAREISYTAPIYGTKMRQARWESGRLEKETLSKSGLSIGDLKENRVRGTRRLGVLFPDIDVDICPEGLSLRFSLYRGGYATTVIREFIKNDRF